MFDTAIVPAFADAANAASPVADGLVIAAGGTAVGAIVTIACTWIKARFTKTEVSNDPLHTEQTPQQANWKQNSADHTDIFGRLRVVEAQVSALQAEVGSLKEMQGRMFQMVTALYEKICVGKKTK